MKKLIIVPLILLVASAGFLAATPTASQRSLSTKIPSDGVFFDGVSATGRLQEAIDDALIQADVHFAQQGADLRYTWRLVRTTGTRGGFAFVNELVVKIDVQLL